MNFLIRVLPARAPVQNFSRILHTSGVTYNFNRRQRNGLPLCKRGEPELLQNPDYSFLDGRTTPISYAQRKRVDQQKLFSERAVELLGEVNYALKRKAMKEEQKRLDDENILSRKLKPKGLVYKNKNFTQNA